MSTAVQEGTMTASATSPSVTLTFVEPLLGLGELASFTLTPIDDGGLIFVLRSVEAPETRLFLLDPEPYFPEYAPQIDDDTVARLGLDTDGAEAGAFVVITPDADQGHHTANLLAPIVFNATTGAAMQVVLQDDWPLRAPLNQA